MSRHAALTTGETATNECAQSTLLLVQAQSGINRFVRGLAAAERLGEGGRRVLEDGRTKKWRRNPDRIERPDR